MWSWGREPVNCLHLRENGRNETLRLESFVAEGAGCSMSILGKVLDEVDLGTVLILDPDTVACERGRAWHGDSPWGSRLVCVWAAGRVKCPLGHIRPELLEF